MSIPLMNNFLPHPLPQFPYSKYDEDQEEFQMKIDSLIEIFEDNFTKKDYEIDFQLAYSKCHEICINRMVKELYNAVIQLIKKIVLSYNDTLVKSPDTSPNFEFFSSLTQKFSFFRSKVIQTSDALSYMERIKQKFNFKEEPIEFISNQIFYHQIIFDETIKQKIITTLKREYLQLRNGNDAHRENFQLFLNIVINTKYGAPFYNNDIYPLLQRETRAFYENAQRVFVNKIKEKDSNKEGVCDLVKEQIEYIAKMMNKENELLKEIPEKERENLLNILFDNLMMANFDILFKRGIKNFFKNSDIKSFKTSYAIFFDYKILNSEENIGKFYRSFNDMIVRFLKKLSDNFIIVRKKEKLEYLNFFQFIEEIFELRKRLGDFLIQAMGNNQKIEHIIKSQLEKLINQNAEFLENFVKLVHEEIKLCQKIRNNKRLNEFKDKFTTIFKLINEKDLFELEYRKNLSKRLIRNSTMLKEMEVVFYKIMKKESGSSYVKKIENMFNDIFNSQDINLDFRLKNKINKNDLTLDFTIKILSQDSWPIENKMAINIQSDNKNTVKPNLPSKKIQFNLPIILDKCLKDFSCYYYLKFTNRFISFVPQFSWGELRAKLGAKNYTLIVSTYQIAILMLFNENHTITVEGISKALSMHPQDLEEHYYPLIKGKLLLLDSGIELSEEKSKLSLNEEFTSKETRINLNYKYKEKKKSEEKKEEKEISHFILEDRKYQLDANIIHVLKQNKKIKFDDLKLKVINSLRDYFIPEISLLKTRLENLIDRSLVERDENNPEIYIYIA